MNLKTASAATHCARLEPRKVLEQDRSQSCRITSPTWTNRRCADKGGPTPSLLVTKARRRMIDEGHRDFILGHDATEIERELEWLSLRG